MRNTELMQLSPQSVVDAGSGPPSGSCVRSCDITAGRRGLVMAALNRVLRGQPSVGKS